MRRIDDSKSSRSFGLDRSWSAAAIVGLAMVLGCSGEVDGAPTFPDSETPAQPEADVAEPVVAPLEPTPPNSAAGDNNAPSAEDGVRPGATDDGDIEDADDDDDDDGGDNDDEDIDDDDGDDNDGDDDAANPDEEVGVDPGPENVTFTNDVRAILVTQCGRCHAAGNLPNFASADAEAGYTVAAREAREILEELSAGAMPLDTCRGGEPGEAGCVSVAEFETIRAWVDADVPE